MSTPVTSTNQQKAEPIPPTPAHGNARGVPVPSGFPAEGTPERAFPGVSMPAIAPEGLADGETDVSVPSTTSF
jgi:hypothetical protein